VNDPSNDGRLAWITSVRRMHRNKRFAGYIGCCFGAAILIWGRFVAGSPAWAVPAGFAVVGVSWLMFVYVMVARYQWVKANPPPP
jgi:hypothetical protein